MSLQSNTHVVLATLKRSESELSSYQRKVFKIDDHMGIAIAGLTADGRILCRHMRNECLNHRSVARGAGWCGGTDAGRGHRPRARVLARRECTQGLAADTAQAFGV